MASIDPFEVPVGSSELYSASVKLGEINISGTAIADSLTRLTTSVDAAFYPVVLTGKNDHTLKKALFEGTVPFSSASERIHVNLKSNTRPIQIQHLIPSTKQRENLDLIAQNLFGPIKGLFIALFGVCAQELSQGQSTENHKEYTDKHQVRILLMSLSEDEKCRPLVFADEVMFKSDESKGPRGLIDLLIGSKCESDNGECALALYSMMRNVSWICQASFAESKKESEILSKVDIQDARYKQADGSYLEIGCVAQPVLEAVSLSQVEKKTNRPLVLFFASRSYIRPFLYYKDSDVMLTTKHEIQWKSKNGLCIDGVALTAVLLCTRSPLKYDDMSVTNSFFEEVSIPKTGFLQALNESSFTFKNAHLTATKFETDRNKRRADHLSKQVVPLDIEYDAVLKKFCQSQPNQL